MKKSRLKPGIDESLRYKYYGTTLEVGDKFYHNNHTTKIGASLPDYLIITKLIPIRDSLNFYIQARYENHAIGPFERLISNTILKDSNLSPLVENPEWIFVNKGFNKEENKNA